jgi:predicted nucleotidyltransferase
MLLIIQQVAIEFKTQLLQLYGNELAELILFGSYARGDNHEESDLDFAVILRDLNTRTSAEIIKTSVISSRLSSKYGLMLSILPTSLRKKQNSMQGVYQEIRREGIVI